MKNYFILFSLFLFFVFFFGREVEAQSISDLQAQIQSHTEQIAKLDAEIKQYQAQIDDTSKQANTLSNAIKVLDISQKQVTAQIKKTETSITNVNLSLSELGKQIDSTQNKIDNGREAMALSLRGVRQADNISMPEILLGSGSMSQAMEQYQTAQSFSQSVSEHEQELSQYKQQVEDTKSITEKKKQELVNLKSDLKDQNTILSNNKKEKNSLLADTKNRESTYRQILADKQAQKAQFEKELFDFESKLNITIDPNSFPSGNHGILSWPLDSVFITQPFGRTVDAVRLYVSGSHNGVDFRATRGTPVKSVADGIVQATGNTDLQRGCYSYGKWILIKHNNGLTSLYGHLDLIRVSAGQSTARGEIIGYSGSTGYATGPHLHLTVYASQGVRVERYTQSRNCKNVDVPVAPANAYLDPLEYLPQI